MIKPSTFKHEQPTEIARVGMFRLYKNPILGDEAPILTRISGLFYETEFYDLPADEVEVLIWVMENDLY